MPELKPHQIEAHPPVLEPSSRQPRLPTRAEYAERASQLRRPIRAPLPVNALYAALAIFDTLLIYNDVGPAALGARIGLFTAVNGLVLGGAFLGVQEFVRRRAGRLGLLCPSCGHYPLGISRFGHTAKGQVGQILRSGRCSRCGNPLFAG